MIWIDDAGAGVAIDSRLGERFGGSVDRSGVTTGAPIRKLLFVPCRLICVDPPGDLAPRKLGLNVEQRELAVSFLLQKPQTMSAAKKVLNLRSYYGKTCLFFE